MLRSALLAVLLLSSAARAQQAPLLWSLADADSRVTLLGSVHLLAATDYPLAAASEAAYRDADVVAFEIDLATADAEALALFPRYALYGPDRTLRDALPDSLFLALDARLQAVGQRAADLDPFRPWAVGFYLAQLDGTPDGLDPMLGVDRHFYDRAVSDGRPTVALEGIADQFEALSGTPEADQVAQLARVLGDATSLRAEMLETLALWRAGDADGIARLLKTETAAEPAAYKRLLLVRNRAWVAQIEALLARTDEDVLVVVGAAHLVGPESVVDLLRARGHTVHRLADGAPAEPSRAAPDE